MSGGGSGGSAAGAAASGAMQLVGDIISATTAGAGGKRRQRRQHEYNRQNMERSMDFSREMLWRSHETGLQYEKDKWKHNVRGLKEAGLNPALMYGQGGASVGGGSKGGAGVGVPSSGSPGDPDVDVKTSAADVVRLSMERKRFNEMIKNIKADTDLKSKQTAKEVAQAIHFLTSGKGVITGNLLDMMKGYLSTEWIQKYGKETGITPPQSGRQVYENDKKLSDSEQDKKARYRD